jgi:hypothetical protein
MIDHDRLYNIKEWRDLASSDVIDYQKTRRMKKKTCLFGCRREREIARERERMHGDVYMSPNPQKQMFFNQQRKTYISWVFTAKRRHTKTKTNQTVYYFFLFFLDLYIFLSSICINFFLKDRTSKKYFVETPPPHLSKSVSSMNDWSMAVYKLYYLNLGEGGLIHWNDDDDQ